MDSRECSRTQARPVLQRGVLDMIIEFAKMKINKIKKAVKTAQLEENEALTYDELKKIKKAGDKSASKALLVMQNVLTDYTLYRESSYINFSINPTAAGQAPEALPVMQQIDTLCPNRLTGSTPVWGGPALSHTMRGRLF